MMAQLIDRKRLKADTKTLLKSAQVNPRLFTALYLCILLLLNLGDMMAAGDAPTIADRNLLGMFAYAMVYLLTMTLNAGFVLYCMAVRRGERAEILTLFDGFSFVGKLISLNIIIYFFVSLWAMLFVIPGVVAAYRYRFALYNLYENPGLSVFEALNMSKRQTLGYKFQLLQLDVSFLGWGLLSTLPMILYYMNLFNHAMIMTSAGFTMETVLNAAPPSIVVFLAGNLWSILVQAFYLPYYQTTELGYFEIAKQTSGVDPEKYGAQGPDSL